MSFLSRPRCNHAPRWVPDSGTNDCNSDGGPGRGDGSSGNDGSDGEVSSETTLGESNAAVRLRRKWGRWTGTDRC